MLFERQKHLLALIEALGGEIGKLDFQKLLFLYCCEIQPKASCEFVPHPGRRDLAMRCTTQSIEAGKLLSAQFMVYGSIGKLGGTWTVNAVTPCGFGATVLTRWSEYEMIRPKRWYGIIGVERNRIT